MREIKFRVWGNKEYGDKKEMRLPSDESNSSIDSYRYLINLSGELQCCGGEEEVLMQYTGLKDNSTPPKEIYEGDIVKMSEEAVFEPGKLLIVETDTFGETHLKHTDSRFYVCSIYGATDDYLGNYKSKHGVAGEVIGNIYENPELMEAKK